MRRAWHDPVAGGIVILLLGSNALDIITERGKNLPIFGTSNDCQSRATNRDDGAGNPTFIEGTGWKLVRTNDPFRAGDATASSASDHHPLNHRQEPPGS